MRHSSGPVGAGLPGEPGLPGKTGIPGAARAADPAQVAAALADAAGTGPYFVLTVGGDPAARPAREVYAGDAFAGLIARTADQLPTSEARVAASTFHLSYAARLWSPVLASALRHGVLPDLADLRVTVSPSLRLSVPDPPRGWRAGPADRAALAYHAVMTTHLEPLAARFPVKIAPGLLDGNAAAALTGALRVLTAIHPGLAAPARDLTIALLGTGRLRGTGSLPGNGLAFTRRSCCLYYRVPGGGLCGDCPLTISPGRKP